MSLDFSFIFQVLADNAIAIIGTVLALIFAGHTAYEGSRRTRKAEAAAVFRGTFKDVILNLTENPSLPSAQIAVLDYHAILSAAQQYRAWVYWLRRSAFDKAVAQYKIACDKAKKGGVIAALASENTEYAQEKRAFLHQAVFRLYAFGKVT